MNVGLFQIVNQTATPTNGKNQNQVSSLKNDGNTSKFGELFTNIISSNDNFSYDEQVNGTDVDIESLQNLLEKNSIEEILDLLNIPYDESFVTLENNVIAFEQLMNLDDLLSIVGMDLAELLNIVSGLLGEEVTNTNIWQFIEQINENASTIISQLQLAFKGEHSVTPKAAQQFLTFLKLTHTVGNQSDLMFDQPLQLTTLKEVVQTAINEILLIKNEQKNGGQFVVQNFRQIVENVSNSEIKQTKEVVLKENSQNGMVQQTTTTRTVTIQLPVEKASQQQELVNQIEKLLSRSQLLKNQGIMKLQLKLYPEHLGSIRIELMQKDGILSARLLASTALGKEMLDSQLHQLKNAFSQQNIQLDRLDVQQAIQDKDLRDQNLFNNFFNQHNNHDEEKEQQEQPDEQQEETMSFQDYLLNVEV